MRKFYLENEYYERFDLQSSTCLMTDVSGLGRDESNTTFTIIGDTFVRNYMSPDQSQIRATINFLKPNQYSNFQEFANFVYGSNSLKLVYIPIDSEGTEYKRTVEMTVVEKGEISKDKLLKIGVTFACKSLFYLEDSTKFTIEKNSGEFIWDITFPAMFNDYSNRTVDFSNNGHAEASVEFSIYGYCKNPTVTVYQNGAVLYTVTIEKEILESCKFTICTQDDNLYCIYTDADGNESNAISCLDIANNNFFKLPIGESTVKFTSETGAENKITFAGFKYFKAV